MDAELRRLQRIVVEAGRRVRDRFPPKNVEQKSRGQLVTEVDRGTEQFLRTKLENAFPGIPVVGEEFGGVRSETCFVIDPLDGTTNYVNGVPFYCVAVALLREGVPVLSSVCAPVTEHVYSAKRGDGFFVNGERRVRESESRGLLGYCHGSSDEDIDYVCGCLPRLKKSFHDARRFGAADYELALVAAGDLEGFFGYHVKPWDFIPGCLLVEEAGGTVRGLDGGSWQEEGVDSIVAGSERTVDLLLDLV